MGWFSRKPVEISLPSALAVDVAAIVREATGFFEIALKHGHLANACKITMAVHSLIENAGRSLTLCHAPDESNEESA